MLKEKETKNVLFVCYANMIRSPIAERLFRKAIAEQGFEGISVRSAGTRDAEGSVPWDEIVEVAREFEIDLSDHLSKSLDMDIVEEADLIVAMDRRIRADVEGVFPTVRGKVKLLGEYFPPPFQGDDVADPVGEPPEILRQCIQYIQEGIEGLISELRRGVS